MNMNTCRGIFALILTVSNLCETYPLDDYYDEMNDLLDDDIVGDKFGDKYFEIDSYQVEKNVRARSVIKDEMYRWKDGIIYFFIDDVFSDIHKEHILEQLAVISNVTCLKFLPKTSAEEDYVHIMGRNNGCHSQVGRRGGRQVLNLQIFPINTGCFRKGVVIHEMMHTIGFYHQHNAPDRDDYITIDWENINYDKISNFNKQAPDLVTSFNLPYDYDSMTHYGRKIFSVNGLDTIIPKDPNANIGQRNRLSDMDIYKIRLMYGC